jgi:hypothetical protein
MQTKLLLSGLALALACAQGCNVEDDGTSDRLDLLEQQDPDGPAFQDAGRVRTTVDAGAAPDAGWDIDDDDDDEDIDEATDEADDDARPPRGGKDGGCRRARFGGRRGERDGREHPRRSRDQERPALDGGIGIPGILGGGRSGR